MQSRAAATLDQNCDLGMHALDVAYSDHSAITVTLNVDPLAMTYNIERQEGKHIN